MVQDSGTGLAGLFGIGPVIAGRLLAEAAGVHRFPSKDHFATCNGTAPLDVSSGEHVRYRLSRSGNRRINHAIHMMAVTQIRNRASDGRAYYERKRLEGKTGKEALRCLKRRLSDVIYRQLVADQAGTIEPCGSPTGRPTPPTCTSPTSPPARSLHDPGLGAARPRRIHRARLARQAAHRHRDPRRQHRPARRPPEPRRDHRITNASGPALDREEPFGELSARAQAHAS
jgi:transposase